MCTALLGFFGQDRQHIRHLVENAGGTYSGDLLLDHTTHLVYKDIDRAKRGEKFVTALSWGIPVLPYLWLQECAHCSSILPETYKPNIAQAADASPATKMQQLRLRDDRPCYVAHTACGLNKSSPPHNALSHRKPLVEERRSPLDIASQVSGQHAMLHSAKDSQRMSSADALDLLSCVGSCQPDLSQAPLTQSPSVAVNLADDSASDTCSDHCSPVHSNRELAQASSAPATAAAAGVAHDASSPQSSTHDIILPDSQPDDSTTCQAGQHLTAEASTPASIPNPSQESPGTVPDSPLESADQSLLPAERPLHCSPGDPIADAVCTTSDSWQACDSPGHQPPACCWEVDAAVEEQQCEAIPDTEVQGFLLSPADMHVRAQLDAGAASSRHVPVHLDCQQAASESQHDKIMLQQQQQQHQPEQQQKQQQRCRQQDMLQQPQTHEQHEPDQLSFAGSVAQSSPSTSCASRAVVIEDSDDESDFQKACKPARPSTASSRSVSSTKLACHRCVHLVVALLHMESYLYQRASAADFAALKDHGALSTQCLTAIRPVSCLCPGVTQQRLHDGLTLPTGMCLVT